MKIEFEKNPELENLHSNTEQVVLPLKSRACRLEILKLCVVFVEIKKKPLLCFVLEF